ncbi:hypothetical protein ACQ4PT_024994 [Festuca glaucescens]
MGVAPASLALHHHAKRLTVSGAFGAAGHAAAPRADETAGWQTVVSKSHRRAASPALQYNGFNARRSAPEWLWNRCHRCLSKGHRALGCRDPIRCVNCLCSGHIEKECKRKKVRRDKNGCRIREPPVRPPPVPVAAPPRTDQAAPATIKAATMARPGAPESRPEEDEVVIEATVEMQQEATLMSTNCAVAWIDGMVVGVSTATVQRAVAAACGALVDHVCVVRHHPEQFLLTFKHQHHCSIAVSRTIPVDRFTLQVRQWRLEAHATNVDMPFHVRVGLENVPLQSWNLHTATRVLGKAASMDYIEGPSLRKECTEMLWVWVWTENPSRIPKVKKVVLPARPAPVVDGRERGRRGLRHRVIVHLALVEDFSSVDANGNPPPPYELPWKRGEVDRSRRHASPPPPRRDDRHGRRDDDDRDVRRDGDDRRGGRERDRSTGWRETLRRSLSRGPRRDVGGRDAREDRGGRRRDTHDEAPVEEPLAVVESVTSAQVAVESEAFSAAASSAASRDFALATLSAKMLELTVAGSFEVVKPGRTTIAVAYVSGSMLI